MHRYSKLPARGVRRLLAVGAGLVVALAAGSAGARTVASHDALALAPQSGVAAREAFQSTALASFRGHYDDRLGVPTLLLASGRTAKLAGLVETRADAAGVARSYLKTLADAYRITADEIDALDVEETQQLPNGAALVRFNHRVDGVEVFRERVSVLVNADGSLNAIGGVLSGAKGVGKSVAAAFALNAREAVGAVLRDYGFDTLDLAQHVSRGVASAGGYDVFTLGVANANGERLLEPARTKPVFFRLPDGLVPAWYVETDVGGDGERDNYFATVVSAADGTVLFRHDLQQDANFTYRVWAETSFPYLPYPGPEGRGATPHPTAQPDGVQPPFVAPNLVALNNALPPTSVAANDAWLPDGATETTGNNVDAFANLFDPTPEASTYDPPQDYRPGITAPGTFDRVYDVTQGPQVSSEQVKAATTQLFYVVNWLHDDYYDVGFDEAAGNAQNDNYGRGGLGNDAIRALAQDVTSRNNANMATPADGAKPRMRMYVFDGRSASRLVASGSLASELAAGVATGFGPQAFDTTAPVVLAVDGTAPTADGCEALTNAAAVAGKIVILDRGLCNFTVKVQNAQTAGAVGVIVADNAPGPVTGLGGTAAGINIPSLRVTLADGNTLKGAIGGGLTTRLQRVKGTDRDGTIDNPIIAHEWGHYISNRLVQNSAGLTTNHAGGMGEGFGDFTALTMIVKAGDETFASNPSFGGVYAAATYTAGGPSYAVNPNNGYYFGIRRYPYSTNLLRNPLTYRHITSGVPLPTTAPAGGAGDNAEVHATGEVWANMLWECYASLLRDQGRLSFAQARERMKRYLVAGYKLMPPAPTFVEARDAILAAARSQDVSDYALCLAGFARRGLGAGARGPTDRFGTTNAGVVESFTTGYDVAWTGSDVTDGGPGTCDADGELDNGEGGTITLSIRNSGFIVSSFDVAVSSPTAGIAFPQTTLHTPLIQPLESYELTVPITATGLAGLQAVTVDYVASGGGLDAPVAGSSQFLVNVDNLPSANDDFESRRFAWTKGGDFAHPNNNFARKTTSVTAHSAFGPDLGTNGQITLESPTLNVAASGSFGFTFKAKYSFERDANEDYDGGLLEISTDGGSTWSAIPGSALTPSYNGTLSNCCSNPRSGAAAYVGASAGYPAFVAHAVNLGTAYAGQAVKVRFVIATDAGTAAPGWEIDDIVFTGIANAPFYAVAADDGVCADTIFADGFEP